MSVILTTEVATCPYCKNSTAVLLQENDHIYICSCGATFVKWWAEEQKFKVETKKIDLTDHIEILGERCENIFTTKEDDANALNAISDRITTEKVQQPEELQTEAVDAVLEKTGTDGNVLITESSPIEGEQDVTVH